MKKRIILICAILLAIISITISVVIVCINQDKTNYEKIYLNSLNFEGRLAEYTFSPKVNDDGVYKVKFKIKDELKDNIRISLYKQEDGKELNIKLNDKLRRNRKFKRFRFKASSICRKILYYAR